MTKRNPVARALRCSGHLNLRPKKIPALKGKGSYARSEADRERIEAENEAWARGREEQE